MAMQCSQRACLCRPLHRARRRLWPQANATTLADSPTLVRRLDLARTAAEAMPRVCTLGLLTSGGCLRQERCTFSVRQADSSADLRAAAFLRALSFYSYPDGRSPWAQQVPRPRAPTLQHSARPGCRA